jgi:hypothetical protein
MGYDGEKVKRADRGSFCQQPIEMSPAISYGTLGFGVVKRLKFRSEKLITKDPSTGTKKPRI